MDQTEGAPRTLQVTAECIITDPAERQRRLARAYELILGFGRKSRAAAQEATGAPNMVADSAEPLQTQGSADAWRSE